MPRTLAELTAKLHPWRRNLNRERRFELCSSCPLAECKPKSSGCLCRQAVREEGRARYARNPEKYRIMQRVAYMTPERHEKQLARTAAYRAEAADLLRIKQRERYWADPEKSRRERRESAARCKARKDAAAGLISAPQ